MTQTIITAGGASDSLAMQGGDDGTLVLKTGPTGGKVNALSFASDGTPTLLKPLQGNSLTLGTALATTSGTSVNFTGIPAWVSRVTLSFNSVSTTAASSAWTVQMNGLSTGQQNNRTVFAAAPSITLTVDTTSIALVGTNSAAATVNGHIVLTKVSGTAWVSSGNIYRTSDANSSILAGFGDVGATLSSLLITTSSGNFDAGSIGIIYEG